MSDREEPFPARREPVVDFVRVLCVCLVVVAHLLMIGATIDPVHGLQVDRILLDEPWFPPVSWVLQIMPLFFVVGGFVGIGSWRRTQARGGTAADFIRARVLRLARPAVPLFVALAVATVVLRLAGASADAVELIGLGVTSPLWFLGAFTFTQTMLPGMAVLHELRPRTTLAALASAALLLDLVRFATGFEAIGIAAMVPVWLFVQQLGFWVADGWFMRRRWYGLVAIGGLAYAALGGLVALGYPADMVDNINPPTFAVVVQAVGQTCLLCLLWRPITAFSRLRVVDRLVGLIGSRLMTVYLWHLPVIAVVVGGLLLTPLPSPEPATAAWWWTRISVALVVVGVLVLLCIALGRLERSSPLPSGVHARDWAVSLSAALTLLPPFVILDYGMGLVVSVVNATMLAIAVWVQRPAPALTEPDAGAVAT